MRSHQSINGCRSKLARARGRLAFSSVLSRFRRGHGPSALLKDWLGLAERALREDHKHRHERPSLVLAWKPVRGRWGSTCSVPSLAVQRDTCNLLRHAENCESLPFIEVEGSKQRPNKSASFSTQRHKPPPRAVRHTFPFWNFLSQDTDLLGHLTPPAYNSCTRSYARATVFRAHALPTYLNVISVPLCVK
jgi:hypothetical protein